MRDLETKIQEKVENEGIPKKCRERANEWAYDQIANRSIPKESNKPIEVIEKARLGDVEGSWYINHPIVTLKGKETNIGRSIIANNNYIGRILADRINVDNKFDLNYSYVPGTVRLNKAKIGTPERISSGLSLRYSEIRKIQASDSEMSKVDLRGSEIDRLMLSNSKLDWIKSEGDLKVNRMDLRGSKAELFLRFHELKLLKSGGLLGSGEVDGQINSIDFRKGEGSAILEDLSIGKLNLEGSSVDLGFKYSKIDEIYLKDSVVKSLGVNSETEIGKIDLRGSDVEIRREDLYTLLNSSGECKMNGDTRVTIKIEENASNWGYESKPFLIVETPKGIEDPSFKVDLDGLRAGGKYHFRGLVLADEAIEGVENYKGEYPLILARYASWIKNNWKELKKTMKDDDRLIERLKEPVKQVNEGEIIKVLRKTI